MPLSLGPLQTEIYDEFLTDDDWPLVRTLQAKYRTEGDFRTIAARFGRNEIVCQEGPTGRCFLPLVSVAALPTSHNEIEHCCEAVRFVNSWIEQGRTDAITHTDLQSSLGLDDRELRRLGRILQLENFVFSGGGSSSGDMSAFSVGPSERALFFNRIRDFGDYQSMVAKVSEMEQERWRLQEVERQGISPQAAADFFFAANEQFRARQCLFQLMEAATTDILIVDPYLDPIVLDFVDILDPRVTVRLLAGTPKSLFVKQVSLLQVRRSGVEARTLHASHDRWVLIDGKVVWHLGASISGLGKSASRISRMPEGPKTSTVLDAAEQWWSEATSL